MSDILIIERSSTLNHLLKRTLSAANLVVRGELTSFSEALDHLALGEKLAAPYGVALIGMPPRPGPDFLALLRFLEGEARDLPILFLSHERSGELDRWIERRPLSRYSSWVEFARIPGVIGQLRAEAAALVSSKTSPANIVPAVAPISASAFPKVSTELLGEEVAPSQSPIIDMLTAPSAPSRGIQILFVDDSASVRLAYRQLLERQGFAVQTANTVADALDFVTRIRYELIIVDYFLPDGNGDELCRKIRQTALNGETMLAMITGTYKEDIIKRCLEAGAVECVFKNEAKELFIARINSLARQIEMQQSMRAEKQRLHGILGSVGDGVFGVDDHGVVTFVNPTGLRLLGAQDEAEVVGMSASLLIADKNDSGAKLRSTIASGESIVAMETVFVRGDIKVPVELSVLPLAIESKREGSVVVFRDISDRKSTERVQWELAHDPVTGLANARFFELKLSSEVKRRRENGGYSAVLYIDLDRFTNFTASVGQRAADQLMLAFAQAINKYLREDDLLARIEGDRFGLMLSGVHLDNLFTIADRFRELARHCKVEQGEQQRYVTASVGVAVISKDSVSPESLLEHARVACKSAKNRGRDQTQIFVGEHDVRVARELETGWIDRLRSALDEERFVFEIQPIVPIAALPNQSEPLIDLDGWRLGHAAPGHIHMFEILIRMHGREGEVISPSVFVPLAERVGLMPKIDLWAVQRLLKFLAEQTGLIGRAGFHINLSNQTLSDPESLHLIESALRASRVSPHQIVFEITETSEMTHPHNARRFIQQIKALGCKFALDDFGTGFSSFSHLRNLPVDIVKIEGSFVEGMLHSEMDRQMVASMINMAKSLRLAVIAEHVDSHACLQALRACQVDFVQGNYLGVPKPIAGLNLALAVPHG